jgi:hypothetical protein
MADLSQYSTDQLQAMLAQMDGPTPASQPPDFAQRVIRLGERSADNAVSPKGAYSAAQVMPATAAAPGFGVKPAIAGDVADADREGADYANALKSHYGDEAIAAAAYNAGPGTVDDWLNGTNHTGRNPQGLRLDRQNFAAQIPFPETRAYVARVTAAPNVTPANSVSPVVANAQPAPKDLSQYSTAQLQAMLAQTDAQAPQPAKPAPTTSEGLGFYKGFTHALDNAASGAKWLANNALPFAPQRTEVNGKVIVPGAGDLIDKAGQFLGLSSTEDAANAHQNYVKGREANGEAPGALGEFGGELLASAPLMPLGPLAGGAATGALLTDSKMPEGVLGDATVGGIAGKFGDLALQRTARVLKPAIAPAVKLLRDAGVNLTPGQIMGGWIKRMEDASTSLPGIGDLVTSAKNEGVRDMNRAAANRALAPIGEAVPADVEAGHDAVRYAGDKLSTAYQTLLPKMRILPDPDFVNNIARLSTDAQQTLPREQFFQLRNILQNNTVLNRLASPNGMPITGTAMKEADTALGAMARQYKGSAIASEQQFGDVLGQVQNELRQLTMRSNPGLAPELRKIDAGWAELVPVESAAGKAGATANRDAGVFSPQQYQNAVRATDTSVRDRATARGTRGGMQDFAEAAANVLPSTMNDSGTARRIMVGRILGAGAGGYEASRGFKDVSDPYVALPAALALGAYSPVGRRVLQATLTHDAGPIVGSISDMLTRLGKLSGPVLPAAIAAQR